ncbi:uncharacterized protein E0L32_011857 [Thyridium curvatum]|uniref:Major facilitator superfamily (MFS) profile domain-containing protein n=1 Tax=Thyridium curvatum TaxID=1093900 RepID=A0A507BDR4_9PEZI|nr:uncharacterized protein E0L32_011857 [Thyridium curvatum]TPX18087.1 hypothetical protein E0L32_011857 [Thyridium curvatum]
MIPRYVLASTLVSGGGFLNGYDTGSIGGLTTMPQFKHSVGPMTPFILGFTVSLVMLAGGPPSVFAGQLADRYGRLKVIALGAVLFLAGAMLQGTAASLTQFLVGRMLSGVGEGVYLGNMSVYICEIAPLKQRGMLVGMPQFLATAGVCAGYFTCYKTVEIGSSMAWRLPYVVQGAGAALLALSCLLLPESPRWLMLHGQRPEATRALQRLDFSLAEAERDFMASPEQSLSLSPWQSFLLLFKRGYRGRTVLALFVLGMVQLSGIDAVIYVGTEVHVSCPGQHVDAACLQYAPVLFAQAGLPSDTASFLASGLSAVLMLAISIPAFLFADKWGRRTSAITGGVGLAGCMLLMGTLYATGIVHMYAAAKWAVIVTVFVFGLIYCSTWNIFGKIYASEIQPSHTRAAANCVAMGLSFFANWLVAILTPILLDKSAFGAYFLFGGLTLGTLVVLAACMPETRGRSLEDIQQAFHQPRLITFPSRIKKFAMRRRRAAPTVHDRSPATSVELDRQSSSAEQHGSTVNEMSPGVLVGVPPL